MIRSLESIRLFSDTNRQNFTEFVGTWLDLFYIDLKILTLTENQS